MKELHSMKGSQRNGVISSTYRCIRPLLIPVVDDRSFRIVGRVLSLAIDAKVGIPEVVLTLL